MTEPERRSDDERTREIAREAAREVAPECASQAVKETLRNLGFDADKPQEVQQDVALLRRIRRVKEYGVMAVVGTVAVALFWASKDWIVNLFKGSG